MKENFRLTQEEQDFHGEKLLKEIVIAEKFKLLNAYIKIHQMYENKYMTRMNHIDNDFLAKAPCDGCRTYAEADKLTDESMDCFIKAKKHRLKHECATRYKEF